MSLFRRIPAARSSLDIPETQPPVSCRDFAATVRETNVAYLGCLSCRVGGEAARAGDEFFFAEQHVTSCAEENQTIPPRR